MNPSPATRFLAILTLTYLILPILVVVPMSFSSASSLSFPPPGLSLRWYRSFFESEAWLDAMVMSLALATISSTLGVILGSLAAYGLRRRNFNLKNVLEGNFMAPVILPSIITAVALYIALGRIGMLGTLTGLVVAHTLLVVPYVIVVMVVAIKSFDIRLEQVAWTMGASWFTTVRRVVIPLLAPNIAAAWIFAFVHRFDEVVVTSFIAGTYETIPKKMFSELILEISPTITSVASLLIGFTILCLMTAIWIQRLGKVSAAR